MSGIWSRKLELSIFGESHGPCVGITINGLPAGHVLDISTIQEELNRRRPGQNKLVTQRKETDQFEIISGVLDDKTTGAPLTMLIQNQNTRSKDYSVLKEKMRPGHADYPSWVKFGGHSDYRGGGHFSGRLTAGLVFAGAICKTILKEQNIQIGTQITNIGGCKDRLMDVVTTDTLNHLMDLQFPVLDPEVGEEMKSRIQEVQSEGDSIGGEVRCFAINVPPGLGEPFFDSFESVLSHLLFSIPAVKGLSFGSGFKLIEMRGSEANDLYHMSETGVRTKTNHNGGLLGGITNGMPVDFKVAIKPTPSIGKQQQTVNIAKMQDDTLLIEGRHDPCIVPRILPVLEAVLAIVLLDFMM